MTRSPTPSRRMVSSASATVMCTRRSGRSLLACVRIGSSKCGMTAGSCTSEHPAMRQPWLLPDAVDDAFVAQDLGRFAEVVLHVGLLTDPIEVASNAGGE